MDDRKTSFVLGPLVFFFLRVRTVSFRELTNHLHPRKLTWNLNITQLKREIIFQTSIFCVPCEFSRVYKSWDDPPSCDRKFHCDVNFWTTLALKFGQCVACQIRCQTERFLSGSNKNLTETWVRNMNIKQTDYIYLVDNHLLFNYDVLMLLSSLLFLLLLVQND